MNTVKSIIKYVFGTKNNIKSKLNLSFFITGLFFFVLLFMFEDNNTIATSYAVASGAMFALWIISSRDASTATDYFIETLRFIFFLVLLYISLYISIIVIPCSHGIKPFVLILFSCILILFCSFYYISKFIDIFTIIKSAFISTKDRLFNSIQTETSKTKALIENVTAFLVSIAGLGIALKAIIEPLINLFK